MASDRKKQKELKKLIKINDIKSIVGFIKENKKDEEFDFSLIGDAYDISEETFIELFNDNGELNYDDNKRWIILYTRQIKELMIKTDKNWVNHFTPLEINYINYSLKNPEIDEAFMSISANDALNQYFTNGVVSDEFFSHILSYNEACKKLISNPNFKNKYNSLEIEFIKKFDKLDDNLSSYAFNKIITREYLPLIFNGNTLLPKYYKDIINDEILHDEIYSDVDKNYKYLNEEELLFVTYLKNNQELIKICNSYKIDLYNFNNYFDIKNNNLLAKKEFVESSLKKRDFLISSFINSNNYSKYALKDNEIIIIETLNSGMSPKIKEGFLEILKQKEELMTYDKEQLQSFLNLLNLITNTLENTNSKELHKFKGDILIQLMNNQNPKQALDLINGIYTKNNLPDVAKSYLIFKVLHNNYNKFDLSEESIISPVLKNCKDDNERDIIIFSDLLKSAFGSNNRSIREYLENIKEGNELFTKEEFDINSLNVEEINTLKIFCEHLRALYNNTNVGKENPKVSSGNLLEDIIDLKKVFSPTERYSLPDRIVRSFCYYAGFKSFDDAYKYLENKTSIADKKNRLNSKKVELNNFKLEKGDFIKGIGDLTYFETILQNGSIAKEFLAIGATSDATPLDTDLTMITDSEITLEKAFKDSRSSYFGPLFFVLKNNDRITVTRDENGNTYPSVSTNLEAFSSGNRGHYGIRTGFGSTEVDYIAIDSERLDEYLEKAKHIIVTNGFYIPVIDTKEGKLLFTANEFDEMKSKMCGLKHYNNDDFVFSENLNIDENINSIKANIEKNNMDAIIKKKKIYEVLGHKFEEVGIELKDFFDLDISLGNIQLIDVGSTGRGTATGITSDFDFIMRIDSNMNENVIKDMIFKAFNIPKTKDTMKNIRATGIKLDVFLEPIDLDISFIKKADSNFYSTDEALKDRLEKIKKQDSEKYKDVIANIILAKQVLKEAEVYKPNHAREKAEGGLGGVGVENFVLQHGGSFYDAAKSFVAASKRCSFEEFCKKYKIWDYGKNFYTGEYDEFVSQNMSKKGYEKMRSALELYLSKVKAIDKHSPHYDYNLTNEISLDNDEISIKL